MPKKKSSKKASVKPELMSSRDITKERILERIKKGTELKNIPIQNENHLKNLRAEYNKWNDYNTDLLKNLFNVDSIADDYNAFYGKAMRMGAIFPERIRYVYEGIDVKISRLESIIGRLELFNENVRQSNQKDVINDSILNNEIFIVHGHDEAARDSVARFMGLLDLEYTILSDKPNAGKTLIEKFVDNSNVGFAVVIMTPDDLGAKITNSDDPKPRARQNVIFELGYFIGKLGREKVCALFKSEVEKPSDWEGVVYIPFDDTGNWKLQLARELKVAGISVDMNKLI